MVEYESYSVSKLICKGDALVVKGSAIDFEAQAGSKHLKLWVANPKLNLTEEQRSNLCAFYKAEVELSSETGRVIVDYVLYKAVWEDGVAEISVAHQGQLRLSSRGSFRIVHS